MTSTAQRLSTSEALTVCVDLDGTLISGDLFWESVVRLLLDRPWSLFQLPFWALRGLAHLKRQVALRVAIDATRLPYRRELLDHLQSVRARGGQLVLATGSDELYAQAVARHLGVFAGLFASDGQVNLTGRRKAAKLQSEYGRGNFYYIGNDWKDLPVWKAAGTAVTVVGGSARLLRYLRAHARVEALCAAPSRSVAIVRALRPHQWVKNLLLFVPLITSHRLFDAQLTLNSLWAFAAFSLCASAIYVANDLLDIQSDRLHPRKCRRPFASGALDIPVGLMMIPILLAVSVVLTQLVGSRQFLVILGVYVAATTAYSVWLKREPVADVFMLASLYVLRVIAGGVATGITISTWLLAFAMFIFLSLAFVKRYTELVAQHGSMVSRGYRVEDNLWVQAVGTCAGYMAVLVLALYITSADVMPLYQRPRVLWLLCPLILFWITRTWFRAGRGIAHHDPVWEALKDPVTYACGVAGAATLLAAL